MPHGRLYAGALCAFALWAADSADDAWVATRRNWWAFRKPVRPAVAPAANPVDALLLEAMRAKGVTPSPPLGRERLYRRLSLDLTGLPPSPGELELYLRDRSPNAYEKAVDRLLASPHYGERWALRWLDVVRYADTNGFEGDLERPHSWRYRDYVVRSFNQDKPYDRFLMEQIAGDEIWPGNHDALIATGFHRAGPIHLVSGNQDEEMNRQEVLTEMTGAIGSVFLGLTVGCARCHNHKFDPIPQADYYRLQAVLAATEFKDVEIASAADKAAHEESVKAHKALIDPVKARIEEIEKPHRQRLREEKVSKLAPELRAALAVPKDERNEEQKKLAKDAEGQVQVYWDELLAVLSPEERERRTELRRELHRINLEQPLPAPAAFSVVNMKEAPATHILKVGDHRMKLGAVEPGFLRVLSPVGNVPPSPRGRREALARWLASPDHPLTARVMVNRVWQFRMGTGIVATPNDFGVLGERPTNAKLLDWLATEFMESGWSVKRLDRLIVLSNAYRQTTAHNAANAKADPDNKLYWRANRKRLEAEVIRDSVLAVAGTLNPRMGGPPVRIPLEPEIYDLIFTEGEPDNLWPVHPDTREHNRRSLYLLNKRTIRLPLLANFDQPDAMSSCPVRPASTHALQALSLMNSAFARAQSSAFARRLETECGADDGCRVRRAYRVALSRAPRPQETTLAADYFRRGGRLEDFCLALINRNEFVYAP